MSKIAVTAIAAATVAFAPLTAGANGVFPSAGQLVVDPGDPSHLVVVTTYGVLTTRDGGQAWDWICEDALQSTAGYHPPIAITADGSIMAGVLGLRVSHRDTCSWANAPEIGQGLTIDLSTEKTAPSRAVAVVNRGAGTPTELWETLDNATTFAQFGATLPETFRASTIDVAPSDPDRIYVSGLYGSPGSLKGTLARSSDRGQTWSFLAIPGSATGQSPYIGAIHPADPDRVYVRLAGTPGHLLVTTDAGDSFTEIFTGTGFLKGFALSPDGSTIVVGGESDGVWRTPDATLPFTKVSTMAARCLTWTAAGLYGCGIQDQDGFIIGLSPDAGATWTPLLHQSCIRGPLPCPEDTEVGSTCPAAWPDVADQIAAATCAPDAGPATTGAGGAPPSTSSAGGAATTSTLEPTGGGCTCRAAPPRHTSAPFTLAAAAALALLRRRAEVRRRSRTPR